MSRRRRRLTRPIAGVLAGAVLTSLVLASTALAGSQRVPLSYFAVNVHDAYSQNSEVSARHLDAMQAARITEARLPIPWQMIEPTPPNGTTHTYQWEKVDPVMTGLAQHGIRAQVMIAYSPAWASNATAAERQQCNTSGAVGLATGAPKQYALAAGAVAKRYGQNGTFWAANPGVPYRPVIFYEVWNAPNTAGAWCPRVDPEGYGIMFQWATDEIRKHDPQAYTMVGGMGAGAKTQGGSVATSEFLRRMTIGKPSIKFLKNIMIGTHIYPGKEPATQLRDLPTLRGWIRAAGFPNTVPMHFNEVGFSRVGTLDFTEAERVTAYRNVTSQLPRTNCNISGMVPYTWATREQDLSNPEDWFGIASPGTSALYPSGTEFIHWADLFLGRLTEQAPRTTLMLCPGMPLPDVDKDGTPDQNDNFPLNPTRI